MQGVQAAEVISYSKCGHTYQCLHLPQPRASDAVCLTSGHLRQILSGMCIWLSSYTWLDA